LHVIPAIAARYGGPSSAVRSLCSALSEITDTTVELATTDADGAGGTLPASAVPQDFPVHVLTREFSERWKYSRSMTRWLRENVGRFDVVHIHALWSHSSAAAARAAAHAGVPYIIRPAGMLSKYSLSHGAWSKRLYWWLIEHSTVCRASCFHATSRLEAADIRDVLPKANVRIVANGVEEEAWETPRDQAHLRRRLGLVDDPRPILLFLSRLHSKKGIVDLLLPSLARMKSPPVLAIVGGADEHDPCYEQLVKECIRKLRLEATVHLLGAVEGPSRWQLFDGADAFVLPSHSENFGIVVAEAMARRCPVVITEGVQCFDHVLAAGAGLVVPGEVAALTQALERVLSDPQGRATMGNAGATYAHDHFCWDQIARQVRRMYEEVIGGRREIEFAGAVANKPVPEPRPTGSD
jgi:glycosyltransferase involved in cell wall biosynthesis